MKTRQLQTFAGRALKDMLKNKIQHGITLITIALSILIVSTCVLMMINVDRWLDNWRNGLKIIAYVDRSASKEDLARIRHDLKPEGSIQQIVFIARDTALQRLINEMDEQAFVFENLKGNPLPDMFEIYPAKHLQTEKAVGDLAESIQALPMIKDVEYGQQWIKRLLDMTRLLQYVGLGSSVLFLMVTITLIVNTFRLALYTRREEIEIMRLVGATDTFIRAPFYVEALIQGALGGIMGLSLLATLFGITAARMGDEPLFGMVEIQFLPPVLSGVIVLCSTLVGWLGCVIALRRYLKI
jgi:cell division transport system permease protein